MKHMTERIGVANQAGGATKTATTLGLAGALADDGKRVCVIDADPQGVTTEGLGFKSHPERKYGDIYTKKVPSLHQVLTDPMRTEEITEIVLPHDELDVIPANKAMGGLKKALRDVANAEKRMALALDALEAEYDYDYVVIDTPPDLSRIVDNALVAAQNVVIPLAPEPRFVSGVEDTLEEKKYLEASFREIDEIAILALAINRIDTRNNSITQREMVEQWESSPWPTVRVHEATGVQEAFKRGETVFVHETPPDKSYGMETPRKQFRELARVVEEQLAGVPA